MKTVLYVYSVWGRSLRGKNGAANRPKTRRCQLMLIRLLNHTEHLPHIGALDRAISRREVRGNAVAIGAASSGGGGDPRLGPGATESPKNCKAGLERNG